MGAAVRGQAAYKFLGPTPFGLALLTRLFKEI
jgi:hypothetical protein